MNQLDTRRKRDLRFFSLARWSPPRYGIWGGCDTKVTATCNRPDLKNHFEVSLGSDAEPVRVIFMSRTRDLVCVVLESRLPGAV